MILNFCLCNCLYNLSSVATISGLLNWIFSVDFFKHFTLDETLTVIRNRGRLKSFVSSANRSAMVNQREYHKRGKDFWPEFELYLVDLLVGVVVDVALVGMLAPYARIRQSTVSSGLFGHIQLAYASLPDRLVVQAFGYSSDLLF
ncbi:hypothetical protein QYF36_007388 [Acer negundo]|nr:hypothetical protein QYF36_007388 [Acer negundo]